MSFIRTFESRIASTFGASTSGRTSPISFRKLARRTTKELEAETYVIDGVDTAPALITILVSPADDAIMRGLYAQLTAEIVSFVEAHAERKGYTFVGRPLARFIVDDALRAGRFAVFAENVSPTTLERLRAEEEAFLSGASIVGGAAADLTPQASPQVMPQVATPLPVLDPHVGPAPVGVPISAPVDPGDRIASGLDVMPQDYLDEAAQAGNLPQGTSSVPESPDDFAGLDAFGDFDEPADFAALSQEGGAAPIGAEGAAAIAAAAPRLQASCLLVDHQSGHTYNAQGPSTVIGRERGHGGIVLRDPNVSRRHAELTHDGSVWRIHDLGSTNGTLVNDVDVEEAVLHDGDLLTIGLTNLEFREGA